MTESFKKSNYVEILRKVVPQVDYASNPLDLGNIPEFPELKNIVLISDNEVNGMIKFKDLFSIYDSNDEYELKKREHKIDFESATNI